MTNRASCASLAAIVTLLAVAAGAAHSSGAAPATGPDAASERVLVVIDSPPLPDNEAGGARRSQRDRLLRGERRTISDVADDAGLETAGTIPEIGVFAVPGSSVAEVRRALAGDPRVLAIEQDSRLAPRYTPNDPGLMFSDPNAPGGDFGQWNLLREGFRTAWGLSRGSRAKVAVVDSGADVTHPDLAGAQTLDCSQPDPDDPGTATCGPGSVHDPLGHGTHVSGLACGDSDNGFGIASAGFDCNLLVIRTDFYNGATAAGVVAAADRGADAINLSLGGPSPSVVMKEAINYAWAHGSIPVAAADNRVVTSQGYPAEYIQKLGTASNVDKGKGLVVTAAEYTGVRASFAGYGNGISVAAYGSAYGDGSGGQEGVLSTYPAPGENPSFDVKYASHPIRTTVDGNSDYAYLEGTSMATPQVSGLVALIRSVRPSMAPLDVIRLVKQTASGHGRFSSEVGWGVIDAYAAVAGALGKDITSPSSKLSAKPVKRKKGHAHSATLSITRADVARPGMPTSGLQSVNVYVSRNGAPYALFKTTLATGLNFRPAQSGSYRFYSVAYDQAGNAEAVPSVPDASVKLG
ncbi:MAG: hypothetical protein EXQ70_00015 [Solirubrobacterales bacterium]|nr:hypothetical protein [Solirubrobacterales bacterium]